MNEENFTQSEPVQIQEPKKNNIAIIAVIIVIVAITAGVIGWLVARKTQTPIVQPVVTQPVQQAPVTQPIADETTNWQTYTNTKYGFEFKYPANFVVFEDEENEINMLTKEAYDMKVKNNGYQGGPSNMYINYTVDSSPKIALEGSAVTFAGGTAIEKYNEDGGAGYGGTYKLIAKRNGFVFNITIWGIPLSEEYKKILSTFKFSNIAAADETANWQTYTNTMYGFSLKYPKDWSVIDKNTADFVAFFRSAETQALFNAEPKDESDAILISMAKVEANDLAIEIDTKYKTLEDYIKNDEMFQNLGGILVDGKAAVKGYYGLKGGDYSVFIENNGIYVLNFQRTFLEEDFNADNTLKKILSTFKFTK